MSTAEAARPPALQRLFDLDGRAAEVTGGAGGLGRAIAGGLAATGASVVVADLDGEGAERARAEIDPSGDRSLARQVDVRSRESVEELATATLERFGRVDVLVNSAGITVRMAA